MRWQCASSAVRWQCVGSASAVRWQCVGSASAVRQQCVSSASGVRLQCVGSASGVRRQCVGSASAVRWKAVRRGCGLFVGGAAPCSLSALQLSCPGLLYGLSFSSVLPGPVLYRLRGFLRQSP